MFHDATVLLDRLTVRAAMLFALPGSIPRNWLTTTVPRRRYAQLPVPRFNINLQNVPTPVASTTRTTRTVLTFNIGGRWIAAPAVPALPAISQRFGRCRI